MKRAASWQPLRAIRLSGVAVAASVALAALIIGLPAATSAAAPEPSVATVAGRQSAAPGDRRLDQAATATQRAAQSVMLTVATAGKRLVAAGERGIVIHSDDCGATWKQAKVPVSVTLVAMTFADDRHGWVVGHGGVVLATDDAGSTWRKQLDGRALAQTALSYAKQAAASGPSEDATRTLKDAERLVADGPDKPLFAVHFWTAKRGIVVGAYGIALTTEDGGTQWNWVADRIPNPKGLHLYGLWARDERVIVTGEQGFVARSEDAARRFQPVASPYAGSYFGVAGTSTRNGVPGDLIAYGLRGNAYRLSARDSSAQKIDTGVRASLLTMLPGEQEQALLFDSDGQILELADAQSPARSVGTSPVGPVIGATKACGAKVLLAGFRGVAVIDPTSLSDPHRKAGLK